MSNSRTEMLSKVFTPDALVRYGLYDTKNRWDIVAGFCTFLRACAHNPFGADDQYNRKLRDRQLATYVDIYRKSTEEDPAAKQHFFSCDSRSCPKDLEKLHASVGRFLKLSGESELSFHDLGILAEVFIEEVIEEENTQKISKILSRLLEFQVQEKKESLIDFKFLARVFRDVIVDCRKQGILTLNSDDFNNRLQEKLQFRLNELASQVPNLATRTQALFAVMKGELAFASEMFAIEAILSVFSTSLMFSLTNWLGFMTFGASLFAVLATLPHAVALMEASWQQLATYGDKDGPKNWKDMQKNIFKHLLLWNKNVDSDKSFHPLVNAFLDTCFVMSTWSSLAFVSMDFFALRYTFLDTYLNVKASLIAGKDYDTAVRDAFAAGVSGFTRGLIKTCQMSSIFGASSEAYTIVRAYYDAMITYVCTVFGHCMYIGITQVLSPEDLKKYIETIKELLLKNERVKSFVDRMSHQKNEIDKWLMVSLDKKLV